MNYSRKYSRNFIPLKQDSSKYNLDFRPAIGRCLIEIKDGQGKITIYAQGIKPKVSYQLELMGFSKGELKNIPLGSFNVDDYGKGEFKKDFNPDDISSSKIEDFNIIALTVDDDDFSSALVGYVGNEVSWKDKYKSLKCCKPAPKPIPPIVPEDNTDNSEFEEGLIEREKGLIEKEQGLIKREESIIQKEETGNILPLSDFEISLLEKEEGLIEKEKGLIEKETGLIKKENALDNGFLPPDDKELREKELSLINKEQELIDKEQTLIQREHNLIRKNPTSEKEKGLIEKEKGLLEREQGLLDKEQGLLDMEKGLIEKEKGIRDENAPTDDKPQDIKPQGNKDIKSVLEDIKKNMMNIQNNAPHTNKNIDYIKYKNASMTPFDNYDENICWYRISPYDLMCLPKKNYKFCCNPFVFCCYRKYKHLMLGIKNCDGEEKYILAVPCKYDKDFILKGELSYFDEFVPIKNQDINNIDNNTYGYRLMNI